MPASARARPRRAFVRALVAVPAIALVAFLCFLPFAGRFLVREDPIDTADAIVVLAGARAERWLEAVDLYREGAAKVIVVSPGRLERAELILRERGVRFPTEVELVSAAMQQLGVPAAAIRELPGPLDNTAAEAAALREVQGRAGWQRVIVVTSKYHTRRTGLAVRRALPESVRVIVRASRYDEAEPARWWRKRADIRFILSELPKVAAYAAGVGK